jgi:hypothetical protein
MVALLTLPICPKPQLTERGHGDKEPGEKQVGHATPARNKSVVNSACGYCFLWRNHDGTAANTQVNNTIPNTVMRLLL